MRGCRSHRLADHRQPAAFSEILEENQGDHLTGVHRCHSAASGSMTGSARLHQADNATAHGAGFALAYVGAITAFAKPDAAVIPGTRIEFAGFRQRPVWASQRQRGQVLFLGCQPSTWIVNAGPLGESFGKRFTAAKHR